MGAEPDGVLSSLDIGRADAGSVPSEPASEPTAEYVVTLQPTPGSVLQRSLDVILARQRQIFGPDETSLYSPHISVSGFFHATPRVAAAVVRSVRECLASAPSGALCVDLRRVLATPSGHVLVDVWAPGVAHLVEGLARRVRALGLRLRPKDVRHLSLASGRLPEQQQRVMELYRGLPLPCTACAFDLVIARRSRRSTVERLVTHGEAHSFEGLLRIPLPRPTVPALAGPLPPRHCAMDAVLVTRTPRKRPSECDDETPPKLTKLVEARTRSPAPKCR